MILENVPGLADGGASSNLASCRSILANLLEMDGEALALGLSEDGGALIFYDFAAAFPSIEQSMMQLSESLKQLARSPCGAATNRL